MSRTLLATSPLSTGDIVGRSLRIFRQNLLLIAKSLMLPTIILCLGRISLIVGASYGVKFASNIGEGLGWILLAILGTVVALVGLTLLWVKQLVLVRYLTGQDDSLAASQHFVINRLIYLIILFLLTLVASVFFMAFWIVVMALSFPPLQGQGIWPFVGSFGMALGIFGLIFSILFISLVFHLVSIALIMDKGEFGDLMGEGISLTLRSFWRSIGFMCMNSLTITLVAYPLTLPIILVLTVYLIFAASTLGTNSDVLPMPLQVVNSMWETGINMIIGPIYYMAYALFYRDLRIRQEGIDIVERLNAVDLAESEGRLNGHGI